MAAGGVSLPLALAYLMEWAGALELPLSSAKQAFETLSLGDRLPAPVTDFGHSSGATPLKSSLGGEAPPEEAGSVSQAAATTSSLAASSSDVVMKVADDPQEIQEWRRY